MVLTEKEREELHSAISEYLTLHGFKAANEAFQADLKSRSPPPADGSSLLPSGFSENEGNLERRWNTLRRLNVKNMELDSQVKQLQTELLELKDPTKAKVKKTNLLPNSPAVMTFQGHRDTVTCIALHPTESVCFSGSDDGSIRIWDIETRANIKALRNHTESVTGLAIEPIKSAVFASCSNDQTVKLFDCESLECISTLVGHEDAVSAISWVGDVEMTLISSSRDGEVKVWDGKRSGIKQTFKASAWVRAISSSPLAGGMVIMGGNDEVVTLYTGVLASSSGSTSASTSSPVGSGFRQQGGVLSLTGHTNTIMCCALSNFEADCVMVEAHGTPLQKAEIKELQKKRATAVGEGGATASTSWLQSVGYQPKYVATGARDKNIFVFDVQQAGKEIMKLTDHQNWVRSLCFTASGQYLVSCGDDGLMLIYDLTVKKLFRKIAAHEHFVTCLSLHPNNRPYLATGGADSLVKIWACS